ncbi:MAG TPA: hypothetical protein VNU49_04205 [Opitutaceae bacterium]|jgi:hypothetical protein|nr:hypothetical protein [Opitutaceae bacterium]
MHPLQVFIRLCDRMRYTVHSKPKSCWHMKSIPRESRAFEFCFIELDYTLVRVEESAGEITIRATADTFSDHRKACFIRELAAEGFIPDDYRWFSLTGPEAYTRGVRWLVDFSWLKLDEALIARTNRLVRRLILPAALLCLLFIYLIYPGQGKASSSRFADRESSAAYASAVLL